MRNGRTRAALVVVAAVMTASAAACSSDGGTAASPSPSVAPSPTAAHAAPPAPTSATSVGPPADNRACSADAFLKRLNTRQRLAQMLTVGVTGTADAVDIMRREQVGGLFIGSWTDHTLLSDHGVADVDAASPVAPMMTIDEEGGRVSRIDDLIGAVPSARETARTMSVDETYQEALRRGRAMKELGITVDFAPDTDVSAQPDDDVIGDRSYSDDPQVVTEYAGAFARGLRDAGIQPVIKHFPGHGSATGDSHVQPVTTPPLDQLQTKDLVPFRKLVDTGVAVMVGHLDVPGLTTPGVPASLSPEAMHLLRTGTGYGAPPFNGVIFTDDLSGMGAITDRYGLAQAVQMALAAGADVALWESTAQVTPVLDALEHAVATGALPMSEVDASVARIGRAKGQVTC